MKLIISPAKKMREDNDSLSWRDLPVFLAKTKALCSILQRMSFDSLKKLWKCSDSIAVQNVQRLQQMDLERHLTPAILAYEGIQYQYMAPGVLTDEQYAYMQEHLRILSGFYGVLRPFDGVTPYRLEMQAKLAVGQSEDLYAYWGDTLAKEVAKDTSCIVNLASREYSVCVSRYLPPSVRFLTCVFGEEQNGKIVEKGTLCKMARGEMVRFAAEHRITEPEGLKSFDRLQYRFDPARSDENTYVFVKVSD